MTLSGCLAPTEIIIEVLKVMPGITTLPPAFRLGRASLPGKVGASLAWPSSVPEAGGHNEMSASPISHLPLDLGRESLFPEPQCFPRHMGTIVITCLPLLMIQGFHEFHVHQVFAYP